MRLNLMMPGNPRYQPEQLRQFFGYDRLYATLSEVEIAVLEVMGEIGVIPKGEFRGFRRKLREKLHLITTTQVDRVERRITRHDIRAWVRIAQRIVGPRLARLVHVPLTSYDALDTARILQFRRAYEYALRPAINDVIVQLANLVERYAEQVQIGRTHGQHALPITVGFWLATILNRIMYCSEQLERYADGLVGKISGAVGAYNAQVGLPIASRCGAISFEKRVLTKLGLKSARISTQILPPEPVGFFLFAATSLSAALGQFGRDCRQLMRTEIGEIMEAREPGQVGSSTMAGKINPITFENLEGTWFKTKNEFGKVLDTLISEHQRDLVGSAPARDFPTILVNLQHQLNSLLKKNKKGHVFLERIGVNADACERNFSMSAHLVLGEPLYIALQMAGYRGDAHKLINDKLAPEARRTGEPLIVCAERKAKRSKNLRAALENMPTEVIELLKDARRYTGHASRKAREIARRARRYADSRKAIR
ncbi:MAG: hypothetical protein A3B31_02190 [Candidatus Komeilibacteria bacterium RIFCSPLOWO2_01_FULL_53_11]|uniref:Fumarate lyase N-terminal domain-containing protein n=1 Tax=Candidatus Komeilibacteria bacterium RIFCSPLOWO2_01_FULL_53_11 TaxID=1798552 RepID=A0A1G2BV16_9BACT|nr:MAG: hypothetical protein A3B31_02190 [Candidatus Komeilibacteria bacterium RIFCSPLOWO2_01_FULL_53_11]